MYDKVVELIGPVPAYAEFLYVLGLIVALLMAFIVILAPFFIFFGFIGGRR